MKNIKSFAILTITVILFAACISEFKATLPSSESNILVVSGDIIENTQVDFTLSKTFDLDSPVPPASSYDITATVTLVGSDGSKSAPAKSMGKGVYRMNIGTLSDNVEYCLSIEYEGNIYTSTMSKPITTPEIEGMSFSQPEENGNIGIRVSTAQTASATVQYFIWTYQEDWEFPAKNYTRLYYNKDKKAPDTLSVADKYYCWQSNSVNKLLVASTDNMASNKLTNKQILDYPSDDDRFISLYCITLTQKAVSKSAYQYYLSKKTENEDMGGIFTPQPTELGGNITCSTNSARKAIGFVSVLKNVVTKRFFIDRKDISRTATSCDVYLTPDQVAEAAAAKEITVDEYIINQELEPIGDWAWEKDTRDETDNVVIDLSGYASIICTDCVKAGGSKSKPSWWPNDKE
ncbi:MAG: DUF4249 family protein [Flavobacteriales bacterium]|nr:DUF4249 family protein [Flavobacteriales bacterium]